MVKVAVDGRVSGAKLPAFHWSLGRSRTCGGPVVHLRVGEDGDHFTVQFSGSIESPPYQVDRAGFHWDFSKVFNALVMPQLLKSGIVPLHAAVISDGVSTILMPGGSGSGKSSVSYAAKYFGLSVYASELAFMNGGSLVIGNSMMTIDRGALRRFNIDVAEDVAQLDGRHICPTSSAGEAVKVTRVAFPRVTDASYSIRNISSRRARMILFSNAIGELGCSQLISNESVPLGQSLGPAEMHAVVAEIKPLSGLAPAIVEGRPQRILEALFTI